MAKRVRKKQPLNGEPTRKSDRGTEIFIYVLLGFIYLFFILLAAFATWRTNAATGKAQNNPPKRPVNTGTE